MLCSASRRTVPAPAHATRCPAPKHLPQRTFLTTLCALFLLALTTLTPRAQVILTNASAAELLSAIRAGGHIRLNYTGLVDFTNAIPVSTEVIIEGTHRASNIISGSSLTRLFVVEPGGTLRLRNVSLVSGRITSATLTNSIIQEYAGAAIYNDRGTVDAFNTVFSTHSIVGPSGAPGLNDPTFDGADGESAGDIFGAAIYNNNGTITLRDCLIHRNDLIAGVGGKGGDGGSFGNGRNGGKGGRGGDAFGSALYSLGGAVAIHGTHFATNSAIGGIGAQGGSGGGVLGIHGDPGRSGQGSGAVAVAGGALQIDSSTFEANRVIGGAGTNGLPSRGTWPGDDGAPGGAALGAGIYAATDITITNSTFVRNTVIGGQGGVGGGGATSSVFGSNGGDGGQGGAAYGGGIYLAAGARASIANSTFHDDILSPGQGGVGGAGAGLTGQPGSNGGPGDSAGADLYIAGNADVANSIFAFSRNGGGLFGNINDLGGNLSSDRSYNLRGPGSFYPVDPLLLPLRNNGGNAPTMGLRPGSPAIARSLPQHTPAFDARGLLRDFAPDTGAYEYPGVPFLRPFAPGTNFTRFRLSFNMTAPEARVESTTNLLTGPWLLRTNVVQQTGTSFILDVPATNRMEFFRVYVP